MSPGLLHALTRAPEGDPRTHLAVARYGNGGREESGERLHAPRRASRGRYDVIVVGARCAGATTAMLLARQGLDVLLVDRARFPSEIPHGHYIRKHGPARLAAWGLLDRVLATGCPPISSMTIDLGDFPLTGRDLVVDGVPIAVAPRRAALDQLLVQAAIEAGAEFREGFPIQHLVFEDDRVTGVRGPGGVTESARFVIGADGRNSGVAKLVRARAYAEQPTLTCWYFSYWSDVPSDGLELYLTGRRMIFAFPTNNDRFAVFVGWPIAELSSVRSDVEARLMAVVDRVPELSQRIRSGRREERLYGAAQLPNFLRKPYGQGWALVGDAGCHKDPVQALGICDALRDAELLAESLTEALRRSAAELDALAEYERRRNEATLADYKANIHAARFNRPPPEIVAALAAARDNPLASAEFCLAWDGRLATDPTRGLPSHASGASFDTRKAMT